MSAHELSHPSQQPYGRKEAGDPKEEYGRFEGISPQKALGDDAAAICQQFMDYARESYAGYGRADLTDDDKDRITSSSSARAVDAFPNAPVLEFTSGARHRGYLIGKFGDPNFIRDSDKVVVLCEDGRLRTTTLQGAHGAIPEHKSYNKKVDGTKRLGMFTVRKVIETPAKEPVDESILTIGLFTTNAKHSLIFQQPSSEQHPLKTVLEKVSGRNCFIEPLQKGLAIDNYGKQTTSEVLAMIRKDKDQAVSAEAQKVAQSVLMSAGFDQADIKKIKEDVSAATVRKVRSELGDKRGQRLPEEVFSRIVEETRRRIILSHLDDDPDPAVITALEHVISDPHHGGSRK